MYAAGAKWHYPEGCGSKLEASLYSKSQGT